MQVLKNMEACQRAVDENPECLIVFSAKWCGPCKTLKPHLEKIAMDHMHVLYVDVDTVPEFAGWCKIKSIPTVLLQHRGETIKAIEGCSPNALFNLVDLAADKPTRAASPSNAARVIKA
jgi:thioredoxin-like negative regulator of GroEL